VTGGGNLYDKYGTSNPVARWMMNGFLASLDELVLLSGAREAHEVGCGEGELSLRLARSGLRVRASDADPAVVAEARFRAQGAGVGIEYRPVPIDGLKPARDSAELIVCCEVLEHLEEPVKALDVLAQIAQPWLLVSVPREPLWRALNLARLTYVSDLGNTPGHRGHWSRPGFLRMLGERVEIVEVRSPLPWTMALCRAA
jgi:SAM-dependent methyltransferase